MTTPEIAGYTQPLCAVYSRDFLSIAEHASWPENTKLYRCFQPNGP